jgi:hypothetical protein
MRYSSILTMGLAVFLAVPALAQRERPARPGFPQNDPLRLLRDPSVQRDLKLDQEQVKKAEEAAQKALEGALSADQIKRLKQIQLQQRGLEAFRDAEVEKALKLSDEQKEKLKTIAEEVRKEMGGLFQRGQGGNPREAFQKMQEMRTKAREKADAVLTDEQKKAWKELTGAPFEAGRRPGAVRPGANRRPQPRNNNQ